MKLLISGETPVGHTGYANIGRYVAEVFKERGWGVDYYAWANLTGGVMRVGESSWYPNLGKNGSNAHFAAIASGADAVLTVQDLWPLPAVFGQQVGEGWIGYFPVDADPLMDAIGFHIRQCAYPVVYSKYGQEVVQDAGLEAEYIPIAIPTDTFRPIGPLEQQHLLKAALRKANGLPEECFLVTMVATNIGVPNRKSYPEAMMAFKRFHDLHPEAVLYVHGNIHPARDGGYPMLVLADKIGIPPTALRHVNQVAYAVGVSPRDLAGLYNMTDVLLAPSMGEGFGMPIVEAQACGVPVITQDCTSMTELTVNGVAVPQGQPYWRVSCDRQYTPDVDDIVGALEDVYLRSHDEHLTLAHAGREFVVSNFSYEAVKPHWNALAERLEEDLAA